MDGSSYTQVGRLRREHRLLNQVSSPHVVRSIEILEQGHRLALVLEDIGASALHNLELSGASRLGTFLSIAVHAARGLQALHDQGIVHNDISPNNVIWNSEQAHAQIIDLDIARQLSAHAHSAGNSAMLEGTLAYMSPEQTGRMNRSVDQRSDLYGLGATLYKLHTPSWYKRTQ